MLRASATSKDGLTWRVKFVRTFNFMCNCQILFQYYCWAYIHKFSRCNNFLSISYACNMIFAKRSTKNFYFRFLWYCDVFSSVLVSPYCARKSYSVQEMFLSSQGMPENVLLRKTPTGWRISPISIAFPLARSRCDFSPQWRLDTKHQTPKNHCTCVNFQSTETSTARLDLSASPSPLSLNLKEFLGGFCFPWIFFRLHGWSVGRSVQHWELGVGQSSSTQNSEGQIRD